MSKGVDCLIEPVRGARRVGRVALLLAAISAMAAMPALAQSEEIEPRTIGERGTTLVGLAGFIDKFYSSEEVLPINYSAQIDVARFVTNRFAVRGGQVETGSVRGENTDDLQSQTEGDAWLMTSTPPRVPAFSDLQRVHSARRRVAGWNRRGHRRRAIRDAVV